MAAAPVKPTVVALLALPEVTAATLYGFYDALSSAGRDWQVLHGREPGAPPFRPLIVSHDGQPLVGANGVRIQADTSFAECPPPDVVCITDLAVMPGQPLGDIYDPAVAWLRQCHAAGAVLASACSGAVLLARTGLLHDLDATSHWAYCETLKREHPRTRWHAERGLVVAVDNPADGRSHFLSLTPDGQALYAEIAPLALATEAELFREFTPEECRQLDSMLRRLEAAAEGR